MAPKHPTATRAASLLLIGLSVMTPASAASLSYVLDQSAALGDGPGYLKVTLSDGLNGTIDFVVQMLQPLLDVAGDQSGIQKFGFNLAPGVATEAADVTGLPGGWRAHNGGRLDGFGIFDIYVAANGSRRIADLRFSVSGVEGDKLLDYVSLSTGHVVADHALFAAKVHGLQIVTGPGQSTFGTTAAPSAVPLPAALWLLASALGGITCFRRGHRVRQGQGLRAVAV